MAKILIGCKLPNGLVISHPNPEFKSSVELKGLHSSKLVARDGSPAATFVTTEVDLELWDAWKLAYRDYAPLKNGSIFEARTEQEAKQKANERSKEKTGFEGMSKEALSITKAK